MLRGDEPRRRRGRDAEIPRRRVARAAPSRIVCTAVARADASAVDAWVRLSRLRRDADPFRRNKRGPGRDRTNSPRGRKCSTSPEGSKPADVSSPSDGPTAAGPAAPPALERTWFADAYASDDTPTASSFAMMVSICAFARLSAVPSNAPDAGAGAGTNVGDVVGDAVGAAVPSSSVALASIRRLRIDPVLPWYPSANRRRRVSLPAEAAAAGVSKSDDDNMLDTTAADESAVDDAPPPRPALTNESVSPDTCAVTTISPRKFRKNVDGAVQNENPARERKLHSEGDAHHLGCTTRAAAKYEVERPEGRVLVERARVLDGADQRPGGLFDERRIVVHVGVGGRAEAVDERRHQRARFVRST